MATSFSYSRPTPTTASYTVRNSKPPSTLAAHAFFYCLVLLRSISGAFFLWLLWTKWRAIGIDPSCSEPNESIICNLKRIAQTTPWLTLFPICSIGLWIAIRRGYVEESLLVLRGMGVQTSTSSWAYLLPPSTRFIPTTAVQDILIHEAFKGFEVRYYLAVLVEGEEDAHVVFPVSFLFRSFSTRGTLTQSRHCYRSERF